MLNINNSYLNPFLGACVEPHKICVISGYCSKGSLQDVLLNDNIKLDIIFKLSFATDIAQVNELSVVNNAWVATRVRHNYSVEHTQRGSSLVERASQV